MTVLNIIDTEYVAGGDLWCMENSDGSVSEAEPGAYAAIPVIAGAASNGPACVAQSTAAGLTAARTAAKVAVVLGQLELALPAAALVGTGVFSYSAANLPACTGGVKMVAPQN
jgi:hypothetical protein